MSNIIQIKKNTEYIKRKAHELGFFFCGISKARFLEEEANNLENWLNQGKHGSMSYMENYFDKRLDPTKLVEGAKSVVSLAFNYYPKHDLAKDNTYKIAKYAYGRDYHKVVKKKLKSLFIAIQNDIGEVNGRVFVDSGPVMERQWARESGIGWIGKNSLLLNKNSGSFFFLAELIIDLELEPDGPVKDYCGTCTACMDACPTDAIPQPYVVDSSKCISHLTIELKENIPEEFKGKMDNWIFGCDICQDVCPWNRFSKPHQELAFEPNDQLKSFSKSDWQEMTEDIFDQMFKGSAIKRTKFKGLKRNINF